MRISTLRTTAIAAAVVALMGSFATGASADNRRGGENARSSGGITIQTPDRGRNIQNRSYSNRDIYRGSRNNYGSRRYYGNGYGRGYRNRGYGNNGFGIYLNLGDNSGCNAHYRKWKAYGSSYWRNRYYSCIG